MVENVFEMRDQGPPPYGSLSTVIKTPKPGHYYALRRDFNRLPDKPKHEGEEAFKEWATDWIEGTERRREHGDLLLGFLGEVEDERELEQTDLKIQRKNEIEARLVKNGWTERDMEPSPVNANEWRRLIYQPKPITERSNLDQPYPKLATILQSNREFYERAERQKRRRDCIRRLDRLVADIRLALPPLVHVSPKDPLEPPTTSTSAIPDRSHPPDPEVKINMPFPAMAELLTWPIIKDIIENDIPLDDFDQRFNDTRNRFDQTDLVNIWRDGQDDEGGSEVTDATPQIVETKGKAIGRTGTRRSVRVSKGHQSAAQLSTTESLSELPLPEFTTTFTKPDGTTTTNLPDLSSNLQILLRADVIFKTQD
ncbi:hypothetical protein FRC07_001889, partial [Ceratobasidium sp. 392]